ncbi:methionyl-tRNA formyltransferase [Paenibacillus sacheonensis]|uniref:Methionyl-tRNA formyltransferase n=1 Tax=Paenibacillus sacheonensis TaxID=742054 RepID=A0A7X5C1V0_9BACL|nr:formyltransferase family protein [Paenibacillus sacheonensis]MBM7566459.1 methionyl-tRNA formyltransferase [Paenibacillus sacheonensis]NBC73142.1 hypothetical protein [Paenibacillus sacheonensis]
MTDKKLLCFLMTDKGLSSLKYAIYRGYSENIGCVVSYNDKNMKTDDSQGIFALCEEHGIPHYLWFEVKNYLPDIIVNHKITSAVAISWQYLIDLSINALLQDDLLIFHDSLLPKYRGFAPTVTAMLCGDKITGVSVLKASEHVDAGDIILQEQVEISDADYIKDIIEKQSLIYAESFVKIINRLRKGNLIAYPQDHALATYSVWRSLEDCKIDWSLTAYRIHILVRAVSSPYPGAYTFYENKKIIINRAEMLEKDINFAIRDFGKVWAIQNGIPVVICGSGMLQITDASYENGEKVFFNKLRVRLS